MRMGKDSVVDSRQCGGSAVNETTGDGQCRTANETARSADATPDVRRCDTDETIIKAKVGLLFCKHCFNFFSSSARCGGAKTCNAAIARQHTLRVVRSNDGFKMITYCSSCG